MTAGDVGEGTPGDQGTRTLSDTTVDGYRACIASEYNL